MDESHLNCPEPADQFDLSTVDELILESSFWMTLGDKLSTLPHKPGVYLMKDAEGEIIYVGKAVSLRNRVRSYFQKGANHSEKTKQLVMRIADVEWIITGSELEALVLECNLIKKYRPYYNVRLRDDKHYPYICLTTSEPFPRPIITRRVKNDGNRYFGPYTDSLAVRESLRLIRRVFKIPCGYKDPKQSKGRACLYYHIGQCLGACVGKVSEEDYARTVKDVIMFLEGKQEKLLKELQKQMDDAAEKLLFEKAARLRDEVHAVQKIIERQKVISTALTDQDVVALVTDNGSAVAQMFFIRGGKLIGQEHFMLTGMSGDEMQTGVQEFIKQYYQEAAYVPREVLLQCDIDEMQIIEQWLKQKRGTKVEVLSPERGEKRRLVEMAKENAEQVLMQMRLKIEKDEGEINEELEELQETLGMESLPRRIEAYDISNIMGTLAVGSCVVFENARPRKSDYRRFKIKSKTTPDDYAMMREVLTRRLSGTLRESSTFSGLPDLLLIDGGKGQLNVAVSVLKELGEDIPVIGLAKEYELIFKPGKSDPIALPRSSKALRLIQRIRDEAHRFAVTYHRTLRKKKSTASILDEIPGIGERRRKALLKSFGSVEKIRNATLDELSQAPSMNKSAAETVYWFLRGGKPDAETRGRSDAGNGEFETAD